VGIQVSQPNILFRIQPVIKSAIGDLANRNRSVIKAAARDAKRNRVGISGAIDNWLFRASKIVAPNFRVTGLAPLLGTAPPNV
jgi:hypothetical protein